MDLQNSGKGGKQLHSSLGKHIYLPKDSKDQEADRFIIKNGLITRIAHNTNQNVYFELESFKILRDLSKELFKTRLFTESIIDEHDKKK